MKRNFVTLYLITALLSIASCCRDNNAVGHGKASTGKSIVVLYENDVHCGMDGYTKMAGLRNAINQSDTAQCIIVSSGDFIQGGVWGALSSGEYVVDVMNATGYSAVTLGNHEFDFGIPRLLQLTNKLDAPVTCVNFSKVDSAQQYYKPYIMTELAGKKLAFVGVVTPYSMSAAYIYFYDKDGNLLYDLYPTTFRELTQQAVNQARADGADYVFLLAHLGEQDNGYSSISLINATNGIDLVLDGHTHSVIQDSVAINKDGEQIHFTQTGTKFANIGKLTISQSGALHTELIPATSVNYSDSRVDAVCDSISKLVSAVTEEKLGTSDHSVTIFDESGNRINRKAECPAGNFAADAFRYCMNAEIGLENGGAIRNELPAGDITYGNLVDVNPFFNNLEALELTGAQLRQLLTIGYSSLPGENGNFPQVSGLKVTIDLTSGSPVISDIQVEDKTTGLYQPLDDSRTYIVAGTDYMFGISTDLNNCKNVSSDELCDAEGLKKYFVESLNGNIGSLYTSTEGRITIVK